MTRTSLLRLALVTSGIAAMSGCDPVTMLDAGTDAEVLDVPAADVPGLDAPGADVPRDAPRTDTGRDSGTDVPFDGGPDISSEVAAAIDIVCGTRAYANCTTAWDCGCDTFGSPRPDLASCMDGERSRCASDLEPQFETFFRRVGVTVEPTALAACIATIRESFDLCLPNPAVESNLPLPCWDAITVGAPIGGGCDFSGVRCADGTGVCGGRTCTAAPSTAGETCDAGCQTGLSCVDGRCATPVAVGGACDDHEDCATPELCVGGTCGAPTPLGGMCTVDDRCEVGRDCSGGTCAARTASRCTIGSAVCGSGSECRSSSLRVCLDAGGLGARCEGDDQCDPALQCDTSTTFPGICSPLPRASEPCISRCETGLICVGDRFGGSLCQPRRRAGERCDDVFVRDGGVCEDLLACTGGVCGPLPRLDERCSDEGRCEVGLGCFNEPPFFEGTCRPLIPAGGMCQGDQECEVSFFCDTSRTFPGVCTALPGEGGECDFRCVEGLECRFFVPLSRSLCVPPGRVGDECSSLCEPGAYCGDDFSAGTCTPLVCDYVSGGVIIGPPPVDPPPIPF